MDINDIQESFEYGEVEMQDALDHLQRELLKLRTGKATPDMVSGLRVEYYGVPTPLSQVANVSVSDSRTLTIQPWDKANIPPIERAIFEANLGLTPQNDGEMIRISVPPLTGERRITLVKRAKSLGEDAKVSIRNTRQKMMDTIKKEVKEGYPEDAGKRDEEKAQNLVNAYTKKADEMINSKENDIMKI